jgi:hypothetical protein
VDGLEGGEGERRQREAFDEAILAAGAPGKLGSVRMRALGKSSDLFDIIPSIAAARNDWTDLVDAAARWRNEEIEVAGLQPLDQPLTNDEMGRRRYARSQGIRQQWAGLGPRFGLGFTLYWRLVPEKWKRQAMNVMQKLKISEFTNAGALYMTLKQLGDTAKKHGPLLFDGYWQYFINLETLGGYRGEVPIEDFAKDIRNWVTGDKPHKIQGSELSFLQQLKVGMTDFFAILPSIKRANESAKTIKEWARDIGNYASAGSSSSDERLLYVDSEGQSKKARKSKWATAIMTPPAEIERILSITRTDDSEEVRGHAKAIQKRETAKVRAVVASDDKTYLRMAYISSWLEVALDKLTKSTLYMDSTQLEEFWHARSQATRANTAKIPLDQAHFDWQQNKRMIRVYFEVVRQTLQRISRHVVRRQMLDVLGTLELSLAKEDKRYETLITVGKEVISVEKGILSGWRWTALMDTAFNWGELWAARRIVERSLERPIIVSANAQGDDDQVEAINVGAAAALVLAYKEMDFEVNPGKFFISEIRDEYLRLVMTERTVRGYLARAINAILWRNPISRDPPRGILRASEQLTSWNTLLGRGAERREVESGLRQDIRNANGLTADEVERILATPVVLGGLGWNSGKLSVDQMLKFSPGTVVKKAQLGTLVGLEPEVLLWQKKGVFFTHEEVNDEMVQNVELPKAKIEIEPGLVEPVRWRFNMSLGQTEGQARIGVPLEAHMNRDLPPTLGALARDKMIRQRSWAWLQKVWVAEDERLISKSIMDRGGRRVWVEWLRGKLPWHAGIIPGLGSLQPANLAKAIQTAQWTNLVRKPKFNMTAVVRIATVSEIETRIILEKRVASGWRFSG